MTARELLPDAVRRFGAVVVAVPDGAWSAPSPAQGWSVRDVLQHVTAEHRWVPHLLGGQTTGEVGDRYDGDVLGEDPRGAWRSAAASSTAAWAVTPDDREVQLSVGPTPAGEYAEQILLDLTVHAWDLARGAGVDERLDPGCVAHVLGYARGRRRQLQESGLFAGAVPTESPDPQDQLLCLLGRRP